MVVGAIGALQGVRLTGVLPVHVDRALPHQIKGHH
jgi:hypothetical protein